jgi:hypothetical protein
MALIVAHTSEQHATCLGLLDDVLDDLRPPVVIVPVIQRVFLDSDCIGGTEDHTAMATNTVVFPAPHFVVSSIIAMHVKAALVDTHLTLNTAVCIPLYDKF